MLPTPSQRRIRCARVRTACLLVALALPGAAPATEADPRQVIAVLVDNAKVMRLPEKTQTVVVGNPIIADVTLQRNGVVVLTGKSFGQTNLIALDAGGTMLAETMISVQSPSQPAVITVQRGLDRESYSCTPNCQPSMQLGDSTKHFSEVSAQADQRRSLATAGSAR